MTKTKILGLLTIILGLFLAAPRVIDAQFPITTVCQPPLTTFSDGSATFNISFPPGGGTTCDTIADCPMISLPASATVYSVKVDMHLSDPASEIGTPYIWVPLSDTNGLVQIRTSDGSFVSKFTNANISDCTANCDTNAPTWVVRGASLCTFNDPSRITVMPGADVWIANRESSVVTKVGLVDPVVSMEEYECKGNYGVGPGARGVTFDSQGNIWVGDCGDNFVWKLNPDGTYAWPAPHRVNIGCTTYGMIADAFGNVWVSSGGCDTVLRIDINNCDPVSCPHPNSGNFTAATTPYGIGMDNEGNIWTGDWSNGNRVHEIAGANGVIGVPTSTCSIPAGRSGCCTGVAVDKSNNVWTSAHSENYIHMFEGGNCGTVHSKSDVCTRSMPHGIAIDFDNHAWVVCRTGEVIKYGFDGININEIKRIDLSLAAASGIGGGASYNYSDMTGLRTTPQNLKISESSTGTPLSSTGTFEVCTDGTGTCTSGLPCAAVTAALGGCIPNAAGNCEIPLSIFSITAGDYTLSNLEVIYGKEVPVTIGGLVPCNRNWDDPRTLWNEKAPCNFCFLLMMINNIMNFLLMLAAGIAVLALIITGLLFVTSSGDSERKSHAKTALKYSIWGFIVIFISWIIVDFLLIGWGYLDPLGGKWNIVDCDVSQTFCGDNIRQTPNDYGFNEECDGTDNPCAGACSPACTCAFVPPPPPIPTFCGDGTVQTPNDAGTGGLLNDGNEECDTDGSSCGSLVCETDCTCKTDPTPGVCGVWFTGALAGNPPIINTWQTPFNMTDVNSVGALLSDWVASGNYPDNAIAFPNAVNQSFDGIAIDENTRLELWNANNYVNADGTGTPIIDITGPVVINNFLYEVNFVGGYSVANCFGLATAIPSWTNCMSSDFNGNTILDVNEDMNNWDNGSCRITCTAP